MKGRPEAMENIAGKTFDVCVTGGGATGAGSALDAQLRFPLRGTRTGPYPFFGFAILQSRRDQMFIEPRSQRTLELRRSEIFGLVRSNIALLRS